MTAEAELPDWRPDFALETRAAAALKASSMGLLPSEPTDLVSKAISYRSDNSI
jgi:hypothetical protein